MKLSTPIKKYGEHGLAVHWLTRQLWCEKQLDFTLKFGERKKEEEKAGTRIHKELHEQIAKLIPIKPRTIEDNIAIRLHNIQVGISRLIAEELTQELPTFGKIDSMFIVGVVDELRITDGSTTILDHKTRRSPTMPRKEQIFPSEFQLMLYYKLLEDCRTGKFDHKDLMDFYGFDSSSTISEEFEKEVASKEQTLESNIEKLSKETFHLFHKISKPSKQLTVSYEYQKIRKPLGKHAFVFNYRKFSDHIKFVKGYWLGERKPKRVKRQNSWKCNYCQFRRRCPLDKNQTTLF